MRKRKGRKRAIGVRAPLLVVARPNARWSLDFVHDQMANGRLLRILNVVDDVTHECLAAIPDTSISGHQVARELTALIERRVRPAPFSSCVRLLTSGLIRHRDAARQDSSPDPRATAMPVR